MWQGKRVMRFIGNRSVPEPELFGRDPLVFPELPLFDPGEYYTGIDWSKGFQKSMSLEDLREFSKTCPNPLMSDFPVKGDPGCVVLPNRSSVTDATIDAMIQSIYGSTAKAFYSNFFGDVFGEQSPQDLPDKELFEVNLTEPLVGFRGWRVYQPIGSKVFGLRSINSSFLWKPCEPFVARCSSGKLSPHKSYLIPHEQCTCGIYAVDDSQSVENHCTSENNTILGSVYGWGRYVRGEDGWRCQFAYPREFHLRSFQVHLIEFLKPYGVPILIDQPIRIYNPEEEGYSNEYRPDKENRDLGTVEGADSEED